VTSLKQHDKPRRETHYSEYSAPWNGTVAVTEKCSELVCILVRELPGVLVPGRSGHRW
jgi:hypothetical protein